MKDQPEVENLTYSPSNGLKLWTKLNRIKIFWSSDEGLHKGTSLCKFSHKYNSNHVHNNNYKQI